MNNTLIKRLTNENTLLLKKNEWSYWKSRWEMKKISPINYRIVKNGVQQINWVEVIYANIVFL